MAEAKDKAQQGGPKLPILSTQQADILHRALAAAHALMAETQGQAAHERLQQAQLEFRAAAKDAEDLIAHIRSLTTIAKEEKAALEAAAKAGDGEGGDPGDESGGQSGQGGGTTTASLGGLSTVVPPKA